MFITP